jgi:two-component system chemotaxis response regulator CheB
LPPDFPAAVAIVQHRTDHDRDFLPSILAKSSRLPVSRATAGEEFQPGHVYLAPVARHLLVQENGTFGTADGERRIRHLLSSANPLFETAASVMGSAVVAVVLTGGGFDATDGVQAVKAAGGTVIAQDEATSRCFSMPASAIKTGVVDYVLPLEKIGPVVVELAMPRNSYQSMPTSMMGGEA